jgi:serine/threonine protein kinase
MPRPLRIGESANGYEATKLLNTGMMAWAYEARNRSGERVFLKQYKSPALAVDWYKGYVKYQARLKERIEGKPVRKFCVRLLDQFEAKVGPLTYFQVFEFVEGGHDLGKILERIRISPSSTTWEQRLIWSRVFMAGISQLHEAGIVHGDLKPPNVQFLEDPTITARWQPKLIDMDFSILTDQRAPWDGKAAYVGSPKYFSPEHLQGEIPQSASDVFTCGLILYQLLADTHPYDRAEEPATYLPEAKRYTAAKPNLVGRLREGDEATVALVDCLRRCLHPNPRNRPSAREVNLALNGRTAADVASPPHSEPPPVAVKPAAARKEPTEPSASLPKSSMVGHLKLVNESGAALEISITTPVGKALLRRFGNEAAFADNDQFVLETRDGAWFIIPVTTTRNQTLLNARPLDSTVQLKDGDTIALGSRTSSRTVLPIAVKIS